MFGLVKESLAKPLLIIERAPLKANPHLLSADDKPHHFQLLETILVLCLPQTNRENMAFAGY